MKRKFALALLLALVVSLVYPLQGAYGQEKPRSRDITLSDLGSGDLTLYGWRASADLWFPGPGERKLAQGGYLDLIFGHSPLLLADRSILTVDFNGTPVTSVFLTAQNAAMSTLRIPLPLNLVNAKTSYFRLNLSMRVWDRDCAELDSHFAWLAVSRDTLLHYEYDLAAPPVRPGITETVLVSLGDFPSWFLDPYVDAENEVYFVLPDGPTAKELNAAFDLGLGMGQMFGGRIVTTTLIPASAFDAQARAKHLVLVGKGEGLPMLAELEGKLPLAWRSGGFADAAGQAVPADQGVLEALASPWQRGKVVLLVSGGNDEAVLSAALALASRDYRKLLAGSYAVIPERPAPPPEDGMRTPSAGRVRTTFAELGYPDLVASGFGEHTLGISFFSTLEPASGEVLTLELVFSHSGLVDPRSLFRVELNGIPAASVSFVLTQTDRVKAKAILPASALVIGDNTLTFRFGLSALDPAHCQEADWASGWAVVHSDSALYLAPLREVDPSVLELSSFPYPWVVNGRLGDSLLVLPDRPRPGELAKLVDMAMSLGRHTRYGYSHLPTVSAGELTPELKKASHLIVYGLTGHPLLRELGDKVPLRFGPEGQKLLLSGGKPLAAVEDGADLGVMEFITSPWAVDRSVLIFTGSSPEALGWMSLLVKGRGALLGNLSVIDRQGKVKSLDIGRPKPKPVIPKAPKTKLEPTTVVAGAVGILVLAGIILVLVRWFRQRKERGEFDEV